MDIRDEIYKTSYENIEYYIKQNKESFSLFSRYNNKEKVSLPNYENNFDNLKKYNIVPLLVTKALKEGRVTLKDNFFTIKTKDVQRKWNVSNENKNEVLRDYFNIYD